MTEVVEMDLAFRLPASDRVAFEEAQRRPASKSVNDVVATGGKDFGLGFPEADATPISGQE